MKGPGILLLLYCTAIVCAVLTRAQRESHGSSESRNNKSERIEVVSSKVPTKNVNSTVNSTLPVSKSASSDNPITALTITSEASSLSIADSLTTNSAFPINHNAPPSPPPDTKADCMFDRRSGVILLMVVGGLIITCVLLVVSAVVLMWKVCQLNRRILTLSSDADLISNAEYWMGTAKKNKSTSEAEAKESTILLGDFTQSQEEEATKDGQTGEETVENGKEVGDGAKNETSANEAKTEQPELSAENVSSPTPPVTDSPSTKTMAALTSEGSEKAKDGVV